MSEEIVRRLRNRSRKDMDYLKESMSRFKVDEAEEDEDMIDEVPEEDLPPAEDDIPEDDMTPPEEDMPEDPEEESPEVEEEPEEDTPDQKNSNPLDNVYAVNHQIGDEVTITYNNGTNSFMRGVIEGYDKEGFYRIKWEDGMTTNGITDAAIADILSNAEESKCVCGSDNFVTEGKYVVCDTCGRRIRESEDPLTKADKSRPAGKKMIRSKATPVSTAIKPSLSETIKNAFKKSAALREDEEVESPYFDYLIMKLGGEFWTRSEEMKEDIEDLGYTVDEINAEYVVVSGEDEDGEEHTMQIPVGGTSRTMVLDFNRARQL